MFRTSDDEKRVYRDEDNATGIKRGNVVRWFRGRTEWRGVVESVYADVRLIEVRPTHHAGDSITALAPRMDVNIDTDRVEVFLGAA